MSNSFHGILDGRTVPATPDAAASQQGRDQDAVFHDKAEKALGALIGFVSGTALDVCSEHFNSKLPPDQQFKNAWQALENHFLNINQRNNTVEIMRKVFELDDSISATNLIQNLNIFNNQLETINPESKMSESFLLGLLGYKIRRDIYKIAIADLDKPDVNYLDVCNQLGPSNTTQFLISPGVI